ncbi:MAG: hypothetical protein LBI49_17125 [Nocardiopsaceae bacterium]|nr:hypothetical protein [Nocardiopsaceae bacterium]
MTGTAATVAIVVALALGWYFAWFRRWNRAVIGAKRDLGAAKKNQSKARIAMVVAAIVAALAIRAWLTGSGRG